jgi:stage V sporulation protein G
MLITAVRFSGTPRDGFLTYASVVFDGCFVVNNLKLVKSKSKPGEIMVCMPSRQKENGDYSDIAHPITPEFRAYVSQYIVSAFHERDAAEAKSS